MGFLDSLAKKARQGERLTQGVVAQLNPLDNNRTYSTVMQRGAQYAPSAPQSVGNQVVRNNLVSVVPHTVNTLNAGRLGVAGIGRAGYESIFGNDQSYQRALQNANQSVDYALDKGLGGKGGYLTAQQAASTGGGTQGLRDNFIKPFANATAEVAPFAIPAAGGILGKGASLTARVATDAGLNTVVGGATNAAQQYANTGKLDLTQLAQASIASGVIAGAVPIGGAIAKKAAAPTVKATQSALRDKRLIAPSKLNGDELNVLDQFNRSRAGGELTDDVYNRARSAATKAGIRYDDPSAIDNLLGAHSMYQAAVRKRSEQLANVKSKALQPMNEGGYARIPGGAKDPAPDLGTAQKDFISEYANMLESMAGGADDNLISKVKQAGGISSSAYNDVPLSVKNAKGGSADRVAQGLGFDSEDALMEALNNSTPVKSKYDWFQQARNDLETGKADSYAADEYNSLNQPLDIPDFGMTNSTAADVASKPKPQLSREVAPPSPKEQLVNTSSSNGTAREQINAIYKRANISRNGKLTMTEEKRIAEIQSKAPETPKGTKYQVESNPSSKQTETYSITNSDISRIESPGMKQDGFLVEDWGGKKRYVSFEGVSPAIRTKIRQAEVEYQAARAASTDPVSPGTRGRVQIAREKVDEAYSDAIQDLKLQDYATTSSGGRTFNSKYNDWLEAKYKDSTVRSETLKDMNANPQKYRQQFESETQSNPGTAPSTRLTAVLPNTSSSNGIPKQAESRFPLRVMAGERADPIRQQLSDQAYHDVKTNKASLEIANKKIAEDEDAALSFAKRGSSTEANATALTLLNKYLQDGSTEKATDLLQSISPRFTRQGQETQILAAYSKLTPAGAVRYASKEVDRAAGISANGAKAEDLLVATHNALRTTAKETAKQLSDEVAANLDQVAKTAKGSKAPPTPEELLAKRIKAPSDKNIKTTNDPVKDMVDTLHKVAKQVIPDVEKNVARDPMELVGQAIKGEAGYSEVYNKAKALVLDKYKDNPEALTELERYFGEDARRVYADSQLNRGIQQGLKGNNLSKLVKEHFSKVDETGASLKQKLIERAGLNENEATQLSGDIQKRYDELIATKKDSVIKQIFGDKPKPQQLELADRILQYQNLGAIGRDELRPLIANKLGLESLSPEAAGNISKMAEHIQTLAENTPERYQATADMMRYIAAQKPQSGIDNAVSVWKAGLLSGVKTQQGNALSNGVFAGLRKVSDVPASLVDRVISLKTKQRTIGLTTRGSIKGTSEGAGKGVAIMKGRPDYTLGDKYEQHAEINIKNSVLQKVFGKPANMVFRGMQAADQPFRYAALKNSLYDQAYAVGRNEGLSGSALKERATQLVNNPTEKMAETAARESKKAVLDYDTYASRAIQYANRGLDSMAETGGGTAIGAKVAKGILNTIAPFVRVPSAFLSRIVDYTPIGIAKEVAHQVFGKEFNQRALSQAIGEGMTGTGIIVLGMHLSGQGQLSGDYPKGDSKKSELWRANGTQANSIKIGPTWVSLNYFGPLGVLLGAGKKIQESEGGTPERLGEAFAGLGSTLLGQSFLQGLNGFTSSVQDPTKAGSYFNSQVSSIIPSWINDIGNVTDQYQRQADNIVGAVKNRIPGVRKSNSPKQDVFGNDLKNNAGGINAFNGLRPSADTSAKTLAVQEASRLSGIDPNNTDLQITPSALGKSITVSGEKVKLNPKQRYDLQKVVGQATQDTWNKIIKTDEYKQADDITKANMLSSAKRYATEVPQRKFVLDNNLGTYAKAPSKKALAYAESNDVSDLTSSAKSGGNTTSVSSSVDSHSKKILGEYDSLSADKRASKIAKEPGYEYKVAAAKYENDKANGKISDIQDIVKRRSLAKMEIGSKYSKEVRDAYGLSKENLNAYLQDKPNGGDLYAQLREYDNALKSNGVNKTSKYKYGLASKGRSGSKGGKTGRGKAGNGLPSGAKPSLIASVNRTRATANVISNAKVRSGNAKKVAFNTKIRKGKSYTSLNRKVA